MGFRFHSSRRRWGLIALAAWCLAAWARAEEFPKFEYHEIGKIGNLMGQTSLVDVDRDGKLDWIAGCSHGDIWWFQYQAPDRWVRHLIGQKVGTEVGGIAMDVDGDGDLDICSKPWNGDLHVYLRNRLKEDKR
jgi:hypothetical protein